MRTTLGDLLQKDGPVLADGAMGTMLFSLGLQHGDAPESWNLTESEKVKQVHRDYIEAGSQIILTNTFGGNGLRLALHNLSDQVVPLNKAAAMNAVEVAENVVGPVVVAGSMGPTGGLLEPLGELTMDEMISSFSEQAAALVEGGVDVLWIETMSDLGEVRAAVEGARTASPQIPIVATMTFDTAGHTMMGVSPEKAVEALEQLELAAFGANCGNGVEEIEEVILKMHTVNPDATLVAKANAGIPHLENGVAVYGASPEMMAAYAERAIAAGAKIVGGCCGSTTDHIRAMAKTLFGKN
ncbi:MAG: betaine--homocysteine S-methyltransferase [Anaerolineales bacterium]